MAHQIKGLAAKPNHLSFIPGTHMWRRELTPASCPLTFPHALCSLHKEAKVTEQRDGGDTWFIPGSQGPAL